MKKTLLTFAIAATTTVCSFAQQYLHQVVVVNEGRYDYTNNIQAVPVTVGVYHPLTKQYQVIDTILGSKNASDAKVDNGFIYVAADNKIRKYDANSYALVGQINLSSVRRLSFWNNYLIATRGDVNRLNSYLQIFDKTSMTLVQALDTISGPNYDAEGMVVRNDSVYVAVGNAFQYNNYKGLVEVYNLNLNARSRTINLPSNATNPENMMFDGTRLLTLNNNDFTNSSVSTLEFNGNPSLTTTIVSGSGCSSSALTFSSAAHYVLFQSQHYPSIQSDSFIGKFDVSSKILATPLHINQTVYGMAVDSITGNIYTGNTDYVSYGKIYIRAANGSVLDSFNVSVSPGEIALDLRTATGVALVENNFTTSIYPNPTSNVINVLGNFEKAHVQIFDVSGRMLMQQAIQQHQSISIANLAAGIYTLKVINEKGETAIHKLVKE